MLLAHPLTGIPSFHCTLSFAPSHPSFYDFVLRVLLCPAALCKWLRSELVLYRRDGPIDVGTDNKGAHDLCHRFTSAQNSRHIDRKLFKMREMRGAGIVTVTHVPTEINPADIFTKILSRQLFERHRRTVLNPVEATTDPSPSPGPSAGGAGG